MIFRLWPQSLIVLEYPFLAGTCLLVLAALTRIAGVRPRYSRYFWRYPPLASSVLIVGTAVVTGLLICPSFESLGIAARKVIGLCTVFAWTTIGLLLPLMYRFPRRRRRRTDADLAPRKLSQLSFPELRAWLADERPIISQAQDFFGAEDRAHRIWNALKTRRSAATPHLMQTVVLEGPLGSGKSSVISLLADIIQEEAEESYLLISVSAWGFSSAAARQHVLGQVVQVLSKHVDCLSVQNLPRHYVEAFTEANKWFALFKPSLAELAPAVRLKRLLPILAAIDTHLVVVIEDSDRNDVDFNPQHLQSMLNDFREVERLSFILTVGSTSRVDFPKVAEQIESIPRLSRGDALCLVDRVRDYCRETWPTIDFLFDEPE